MIGTYYYNLYKKYFKIKKDYGIKLYHIFRYRYGEFINNPEMYIKNDFLLFNEVIFDIGTQYGDYALLWEKWFNADVYAFELLHLNYKILLKNIKINDSLIHPYNIAIGNGQNINYFIKGNMANKGYIHYKETFTATIDNLVSELKVIPKLIKIDVEGFEYEVLYGGLNFLKQYRPKIILEVHSKKLFEKCNNFLLSLNYKLTYTDNERSNGLMDYVANLYYL